MTLECRSVVVAQRLFVSPVTVRRHISGILEKLGAPDRSAAVRMFQAALSR